MEMLQKLNQWFERSLAAIYKAFGSDTLSVAHVIERHGLTMRFRGHQRTMHDGLGSATFEVNNGTTTLVGTSTIQTNAERFAMSESQLAAFRRRHPGLYEAMEAAHVTVPVVKDGKTIARTLGD
jgi:hypothetical protein